MTFYPSALNAHSNLYMQNLSPREIRQTIANIKNMRKAPKKINPYLQHINPLLTESQPYAF